MKIIKTLLISCMLTGAAVNANAIKPVTGIYNQTPDKTICIKNPQAANADQFFSSATMLFFEVYKAGTSDEVAKLIKTLSADPNVDSVAEGVLVGDYQGITVVLKSQKNKAWFVSLFKKAGLNHIKINNNPVTEVDKI
jgi:hypothetical protein